MSSVKACGLWQIAGMGSGVGRIIAGGWPGSYMTFEEKLLGKVRELSPAKQREVLDFVDSLKGPDGSKQPLRSLEGLWADLDIGLSEKDIEEARREMWGTFPREVRL